MTKKQKCSTIFIYVIYVKSQSRVILEIQSIDDDDAENLQQQQNGSGQELELKENQNNFEPPKYVGIGRQTRGVDPIILIQDPGLISELTDFYGIQNLTLQDCIIARNHELIRPKKLYIIQGAVREFVKQDYKNQLKVMALGVKAFEKQEIRDKAIASIYRIAQEGLPLLLPHITKQRLYLNQEELISLLQDRMLGIPNGTKIPTKNGEELQTEIGENWNEKYPSIKHTINDQNSVQQLENIYVGGCVCMLVSQKGEDTTEGALVANAPIAVSCWRGRTNVAILVQKTECAHILDKLKMLQGEN
eukprot:TRINITY_DN13300_c0_g2_i1.p2 TRINITY_DN13300_c0_g2~~TRINITY_DN13300_c0_g2_i1.p2  ORF type:complete len:333 (+),score=53.37 TRINITY_DN13300_c0_g2_i1:88-999(+)